MSALQTSDALFFNETSKLDKETARQIVAQSLTGGDAGSDDGELFLEHRQSETLVFDDGHLKTAAYNISQGFGLRSIFGEASAYAHGSSLDETTLKNAAQTLHAIKSQTKGQQSHTSHRIGQLQAPPNLTSQKFYSADNPLHSLSFDSRIELLEEIETFARQQDPRIVQVTVSMNGSWQAIAIMRANAEMVADIRPNVGLSVSVILEENGRRETGSYGFGGRTAYTPWIQKDKWQGAVKEAIRQARVNLRARPAPAGEMCVVLGPGWPGVLLHEAVGHGLEGDFNRKKTSAFTGLIGQQVAARGVFVVDDGTLPNRRGSITIDDEGTPAARNLLIEDGILVGYMQDRQNARLMGMQPTGNARRQSFAHAPMPRMTNTYMLSGEHSPDDILHSVKDGIYAVNFGGGQVDITSGKFTFQCTEAYEIKGGKIGQPLKGATLIGNGPEIMKRISMLGNDMELDPGIGTCGKQGQGVAVGIGQPTIRIDAITVGGTA